MREKRAVPALLMFLLGIMAVYSQDAEGAAAIAPQGDLPDIGFFAASDRFWRNMTVNVTNLDSGQTTHVVITKGLDASSHGFLMTLSCEAANMIGIYDRGRIARVRVTPMSDFAFLVKPEPDSKLLPTAEAVAPYKDPPLEPVVELLLPAMDASPPVSAGGNGAETGTVKNTPVPDSRPLPTTEAATPYKDPGKEVVIRAPDPVIDLPLPEMDWPQFATAEKNGVAAGAAAAEKTSVPPVQDVKATALPYTSVIRRLWTANGTPNCQNRPR
jgi:hypothetical protein